MPDTAVSLTKGDEEQRQLSSDSAEPMPGTEMSVWIRTEWTCGGSHSSTSSLLSLPQTLNVKTLGGRGGGGRGGGRGGGTSDGEMEQDLMKNPIKKQGHS